MISIIVDEGYAYDYLAILAVKGNKQYHDTTYEHIESQIGRELHKKIIESREFHDLYEANVQTFNAVELARYWEISAKEVDKRNMERYTCKVALQNKFFPNNKILETKT
jgi:hypothetical protein